jgi:hypothetical protein
MPASSNFAMAKGRDAGGAITKKRFVKMSADQTVVQCTVAGERVYGVSMFSVTVGEIAKGKGASVLTDGRCVVEASEAIAVGQPVATAADGRAKIATTGNFIAGTCDEPASGAGAECSVDRTGAGGVV